MIMSVLKKESVNSVTEMQLKIPHIVAEADSQLIPGIKGLRKY